MGVTLLGAFLIPLCLLWWNRPERLIELTLIVGIFQAAAVATIGGLGLQPPIGPSLAFLSFVALQFLLGARYPGSALALRICLPFILVGVWTVVGSLLLPRLFEDAVLVWPQKGDSVGGRILLAPSSGNFTQDGYLVLNQIMLVFAACYFTKTNLKVDRFYKAYLLGGWIVCIVCFWQMAHRTAGVPFPDIFFYSNPSWAILDTQMAGPVPRINATFTEPAACASYLTGTIFSTIWIIIRGHRLRMASWLVPVSIMALCITTSTTGYAALVVGAPMLMLYAISTGSAPLIRRLSALSLIGVCFAGGGWLAASALAPQALSAASSVMSDTSKKQQSASYQERSQADADSLEVAAQTWGLGAGWGSNRASSLIPALLATIGVFGLIGLIFADWKILHAGLMACRRAGTEYKAEALAIDGMIGGLIGRVTAACISGPTLGTLDFYTMIALIAASVARVKGKIKAT
ncbi:hypothetical protein ABUE34_11695 [Kozakia baliensis]|uniref:hypothetical protein n=1 Tax=Kozakia baliensis TaxID=153496 RepID=UPI00345C0307